nr:hypothetical protein ACMD2_25315 [Ipomoea batatas]
MAEVIGDLECKPNCDVILDESPVRKPGSHDRPENILSSGPESSFPATPLYERGHAVLNISEYIDGLHVAGEPYAPLQQYSGVPNALQALLHACPSAARSSSGHIRFSVAGGVAPAPLHSTWLEPQSPVAQLPCPVLASKLHPVRPQIRPDQLAGAWNSRDPPGPSSNPVLSNLSLPALARIPGHTV